MIDGIKETTLFGKTTTTIKFDGTAEQAMTVFNAAKDRDNAKKAKDKAVKAKVLAEKQKADMEHRAATSEATTASGIKKANTLNSLYTQAVLDRDSYKAKADKAEKMPYSLVSIGFLPL